MRISPLFDSFLAELESSLVLAPDQPDETVDSTLRALWQTASGNPCSATLAASIDLPDLTKEQVACLRKLIAERLAGLPLIRVTGRANFMALELEFAPDVFVIRPETELLGYAAVEQLIEIPAPVMIDVGCGSGNLTCGIASLIPNLSVFAVDILESCVKLTRNNVARCGLSHRVKVASGDLFAPLGQFNLENSVDAVVCNPPYIASSRLGSDRAYLTAYEPLEAFDGGPFGLRLQQRLISEAVPMLKPGGCLLFEFGAGQDRQVRKLFDRAGKYGSIEMRADKDGINRVVIARKE
jgi:release factor glutamine methyltransferase